MRNKRLNTSLRTSVLKNKTNLNTATQAQPETLAGKKVYPGTQRYEVQSALEISYRNGTVQKVSPHSSNLINDLTVMLAHGAQISPEPLNFSLLTRQTDTEEINNENIMPDYRNVQNKNIDATQSFKNFNDSFYTLDEQRPRKIQESLDFCEPASIESLNRASVTSVAFYFANNKKYK